MEREVTDERALSTQVGGVFDILVGDVTPERLQAFDALRDNEIPDKAVKEHMGKGGKKFTYIDHVWATQQLRAAFASLWNFEVMDPMVYQDGSVTVLCRLTIKFMVNGQLMESVITEVGAWEDASGKMPVAMRVASAASRGLVRTVFRRFGLGEQFYSSDVPEITAKDCFKSIMSLADRKNMSRDDVIGLLRESDISSENLVERYVEAYKLVEGYEKK